MTTPRLSVQLYSVREALDADLDGTLARIAGLGFGAVEAFDFVRRAPELAAVLDRHGLEAPTGHATLVSDTVGFPVPTPAPALDEVFAAARELGMAYVIDPMVGPERWAAEDEVAATAARLNAAAVVARDHGLRVGYHNHSQEFHHCFDGVSAFERFVSLLDDDVVIELDAYWAQVGGQDVPALVARLGDRLVALHVKDGRVGEDPFRTGRFDPAALGQVPAGGGEVPLDAILDAAAGLEYAIAEFDHYEGDVFEGLGGSVRFLAERGVRR